MKKFINDNITVVIIAVAIVAILAFWQVRKLKLEIEAPSAE